jgi:glycyl-tRNA synthetase
MVSMENLVNLCKRRGLVFQSSEIYGGTGSVWDYGPLGVELKNHIKRLWWRDNIHLRDDMVGLDAGILMHPKTWEASGHVAGFNDPKVDCRKCKGRFRFDDLVPDERISASSGILTAEAWTSVLYDPHSKTAIALLKISLGEGETKISGLALDVDGNRIRASARPATLPWEAREALSIGLTPRSPVPGEFYAFFEIPETARLEKAGSISIAIGQPAVPDILLPQRVKKFQCPQCGGQLTEPRMFNLMFKTFMGPVEDDAATTYLRPETAQGIFVNFANVLNASRKKLPFGIGQIGKAFRNEITPGNFIFRTREFEQMEIEYFCRPGEDERLHQEWIDARLAWYARYGIRRERLKLFEHPKEKLAHYSKRTVDILYEFPIGWSELEGIANRTDFDLSQHARHSGQELTYFDDENKRHVVPYVIEPSAGVDRTFLAFLCDGYLEEQVRNETRTVLKLHPELAPIKTAVLPLLKKRDDLVARARELTRELRQDRPTVYDDTASIGRLYRRQDEVGTPYCVTVDVDTIENDRKVTVRDRDSMQQIRVPIDGCRALMRDLFDKGWSQVAPGAGLWTPGAGSS